MVGQAALNVIVTQLVDYFCCKDSSFDLYSQSTLLISMDYKLLLLYGVLQLLL